MLWVPGRRCGPGPVCVWPDVCCSTFLSLQKCPVYRALNSTFSVVAVTNRFSVATHMPQLRCLFIDHKSFSYSPVTTTASLFINQTHQSPCLLQIINQAHQSPRLLQTTWTSRHVMDGVTCTTFLVKNSRYWTDCPRPTKCWHSKNLQTQRLICWLGEAILPSASRTTTDSTILKMSTMASPGPTGCS